MQVGLVSLLKGEILHNINQVHPALVHHFLCHFRITCLCSLKNTLRFRLDLIKPLDNGRYCTLCICCLRKFQGLLQHLRINGYSLFTDIDPDRICVEAHAAVIVIIDCVKSCLVICNAGVVRIRKRISVFVYLSYCCSTEAVIAVLVRVCRKCQSVVTIIAFCPCQFFFCKCLYNLRVTADLAVLIFAYFSGHTARDQIHMIKLRCIVY